MSNTSTFSLKKGARELFKIKGGKLHNQKVLLSNENKGKTDFPEIIVQDGTLQQIPSYEDRDCLYIAGPSGAGKSTYAAQYAKEYKSKFPNNNVILFSPKIDVVYGTRRRHFFFLRCRLFIFNRVSSKNGIFL